MLVFIICDVISLLRQISMQNVHFLYTACKYCQSDVASIGGPVIIKSSFVVINFQVSLFLLLVIIVHVQNTVAEMFCVCSGKGGRAATGMLAWGVL